MGYESKIVIAERSENKTPNGKTLVWGNEIARFDLSKMGWDEVNGKSFPALFTHEIDFDIYINPEQYDKIMPDNYFREDMYGDICKWASVDTVIDWLEASGVANTYRRAKLFLGFLRVLRDQRKDYGQLCVVHYGY